MQNNVAKNEKQRGINTNWGMQKREELIEMLSQIDDAGTIEYLHTFIRLFLEKWG